MMAANNVDDPPILMDYKDNGHDVYCYIPVRTLVGFTSERFKMDFTVHCFDLSTSWRLEILYTHNPDTGMVVCFVTLGRTDPKHGCVKAYVLVSYINDYGHFVGYPKFIGNGEVLAGNKIEGYAEESRHPGYRSYIFGLGLKLRVSVLIRSCHPSPTLQAKAGFRTVEKEMHRSKL